MGTGDEPPPGGPAAAAPAAAGASAAASQPPAPRPPLANLNIAENPALDSPRAFGEATKQAAENAPPSGIAETPYEPVEERPYNRDESQDATRQTITLWLIGLLCAIVALAFVGLFARGASSGFRDEAFFRELKQVLDVLVGPVVTLLASAVGFYFGYKQGELRDPGRGNEKGKS